MLEGKPTEVGIVYEAKIDRLLKGEYTDEKLGIILYTDRNLYGFKEPSEGDRLIVILESPSHLNPTSWYYASSAFVKQPGGLLYSLYTIYYQVTYNDKSVSALRRDIKKVQRYKESGKPLSKDLDFL